MRARFAGVVLLFSWSLGACGGAQPRSTERTSAGEPIRSAVVVAPEHGRAVPRAPGRRVVVARTTPSPSARAAPLLADAQQRALAFEHEAALDAIGQAQVLLERDASTEADYDALYLCLAYRALVESNLGRPERAEEALRAAALLRPSAELDEVRFPPDLRELYARLASEARAARPAALAVTAAPAGAEVMIHGRPVARAPATIHAPPGQHYLRVDAVGRSARVLVVTLAAEGNAPMHVELPMARAEDLAARLVALPDDELGGLSEAEREDLARVLDADVLVRVTADGAAAFGIGLSDGRTASTALDGPAGGIGWLEARVAPAPIVEEEEGARSAITSPWLWLGVGLAVAAGAAVGVGLAVDSASQERRWAIESR